MRFRSLVAGALAAALLPAAAQAGVSHLGPRAGFTFDPDQFTIGGQMRVVGFAPNWSFDPNLELGFGDDFTVVALNADVAYHLALRNSNLTPYFGGGLGLNFISWDAPAGFRGDTSNTELGMNVLVGLAFPMQSNNRFFTELRFGIGDIPDLKLMAGWDFPL